MKKLLAIGLIVFGMTACNDTGTSEKNMQTIEDQGPDGTLNQDPTGTNPNDAYRDDTGASGLTTDTSVINKSTDNIRRQ